MSKLRDKIRVGITMGDPFGVGPEIMVKALSRLKGLAHFVVIGDEWVSNKTEKIGFKDKNSYFVDLCNVPRQDFSFGKTSAIGGKASIEYLDKALELIKNKKIDCIVTCPISKEAINLAGFHYGGHTEYFLKHSGVKNVVMMLLNERLKLSLVTRHIPLKDVSHSITKDVLISTIALTYKSLQKMFGIKKPRVVVCGLNPHASDNGVIGQEENKMIKPVLRELKSKIGIVYGPMSSDVAIARACNKEYDGVIAMYHDQALIPLKLLGNEFGVNLTLGLSFVRTSCLHGTAFDIAGANLADPGSLISAIKLAVKCTSNLKKA